LNPPARRRFRLPGWTRTNNPPVNSLPHEIAFGGVTFCPDCDRKRFGDG
jgi:hypothetical protein